MTAIEVGYNLYMKKFEKDYFVKTDRYGVNYIGNRRAVIRPWAPPRRDLALTHIDLPPGSKKLVLEFLRPFLGYIPLSVDNVFIAVFREQYLDDVCRIVNIRKKGEIKENEE